MRDGLGHPLPDEDHEPWADWPGTDPALNAPQPRPQEQRPASSFPIAEPSPPPVMISRPCGCTFMDIGEGGPPVQISWCDPHDPGYTPYEYQGPVS